MEINPVVVPIVIVVVAIIYLTIRDANDCTALIQSVHDRNLDTMKNLLQEGHHIDCQDRNGWTPLCHAAKLGYNDITMGLLHKKSEPSRPLFIAAEYGSYSVVRALIAHGADPNMDYMGQTALSIAVKNTHKSTLNVLLNAKADPNIKYMSRSPLHTAIEIGSHGVITALLSYKANPNETDELGRTPLHIAVWEKGDAWAVSVLLEAGADYHQQYMRKTPLQLAEEKGYKVIANYLRDAEISKKKELREHTGSSLR